MPFAEVNNIKIHYELSTSSDTGPYIVFINGLADDLTTWAAQVPAFEQAGYRLLTYDNRGIGQTSAPPGPYTADLLASDLHALLQHLTIDTFHLLGVSMGGMIAQSYALNYPNSPESKGTGLLSLNLCCTYAQPTLFCSRMFALWAEMAQRMSVRDVMRDVTLWAFTVPFFRTRTAELEEVEQAMRELEMPLEAYLAQLSVIQTFDTTAALEALKKDGKGLGGLEKGKVMVLAGEEDILIPVVLSKELSGLVEGSVWRISRGGHGCMVSCPVVVLEAGEMCADFDFSGSFRTTSTVLCSRSWTNSNNGICETTLRTNAPHHILHAPNATMYADTDAS